MKKLIIIMVIGFMVFNLSGTEKQVEKFPVSVKKVNGFHFLYYEFKGPYMAAFKGFNKIIEYMKQNKIEAGECSVGVYYDDPQKVKPENLRSEIGFMVKSKIKTNGKFKYRKIEGFKAAFTRYKSMADIPGAWRALGSYVYKNKLTVTGPGFEFYKAYSSVINAECLMPVK